MSRCPHIIWALRQRGLNPTAKLVLIALCERANGARACWPRIDLIAKDCDIARRSVIQAIKLLCGEDPAHPITPLIARVTDPEERARLLTAVGYPPNQKFNMYRILRPADDAADAEEPKRRRKDGAKSAPSGGTGNGANPAPSEPFPWNVTDGDNGAKSAPYKGANPAPSSGDNGAKSGKKWCKIRTDDGAKSAPKDSKERLPKNVPSTLRSDGTEVSLRSTSARARNGVVEPDGFAAFWQAYPRKTAKGRARTAYARALKKIAPNALLAAVLRHQFDARPKFIPHPATWLNDERWLDERDTFDPVLRAVGLTPADYADRPLPSAFAIAEDVS